MPDEWESISVFYWRIISLKVQTKDKNMRSGLAKNNFDRSGHQKFWKKQKEICVCTWKKITPTQNMFLNIFKSYLPSTSHRDLIFPSFLVFVEWSVPLFIHKYYTGTYYCIKINVLMY